MTPIGKTLRRAKLVIAGQKRQIDALQAGNAAQAIRHAEQISKLNAENDAQARRIAALTPLATDQDDARITEELEAEMLPKAPIQEDSIRVTRAKTRRVRSAR